MLRFEPPYSLAAGLVLTIAQMSLYVVMVVQTTADHKLNQRAGTV